MVLTANDVPGKKNIVKIAIVFIDKLSFFISTVSSWALPAITLEAAASSCVALSIFCMAKLFASSARSFLSWMRLNN